MPYGADTGPFAIKEGTVSVGAIVAPETIGVDGNDPLTKFTGDIISHIEQGSMNIGMSREYAEAWGNTPGQLLRKDLIKKTLMFEGNMYQVNSDLMALLWGMTVQAGYVGGAKTWDLGHYGPDEPTQGTNAFLITTKLTNGLNFYVALYTGKVTTEDISLVLDGAKHGVIPAKIEAFPTASVTDDTKSYGSFWKQTA